MTLATPSSSNCSIPRSWRARDAGSGNARGSTAAIARRSSGPNRTACLDGGNPTSVGPRATSCMFGRFNLLDLPFLEQRLVLVPAHHRPPRVDLTHRDAALDRANQAAHVAADACVGLDREPI